MPVLSEGTTTDPYRGLKVTVTFRCGTRCVENVLLFLCFVLLLIFLCFCITTAMHFILRTEVLRYNFYKCSELLGNSSLTEG